MCKIHGKWVERKERRKWGSDRGGVLVKADILHGSPAYFLEGTLTEACAGSGCTARKGSWTV